MLRSFTARHVGLRRSRLGSFRKDLIWRSWFRYGGHGSVGYVEIRSVIVR